MVVIFAAIYSCKKERRRNHDVYGHNNWRQIARSTVRSVESALLCSENIKSRCKYRTNIVTFILFNYNYNNTLRLNVFGFHWFKRRKQTRVVTNLLYNYLRFWYLVLTNEPYIHTNGFFDPTKNLVTHFIVRVDVWRCFIKLCCKYWFKSSLVQICIHIPRNTLPVVDSILV